MTTKHIEIKEELYNWLRTKYPKQSFSKAISRLVDENIMINKLINIKSEVKPIESMIIKPTKTIITDIPIKRNRWDKIDKMTEDEHIINLKRTLNFKLMTQEEFDDQMKKHEERIKSPQDAI